MRQHLQRVAHLGDGRWWWDSTAQCWRSDYGKPVALNGGMQLAKIPTTYAMLGCAHLDHKPGNNRPAT